MLIALELGNGTIPPEGYYYQGKAYEALGQFGRALTTLKNITDEQVRNKVQCDFTCSQTDTDTCIRILDDS